MKRISLFVFLAAQAFMSPAFSGEISEKFQASLQEACLKIDTAKNCSCWAKSVTERYDDGQLVAITKLLRNPQANQMFMVTHSVEGRICQSAN